MDNISYYLACLAEECGEVTQVVGKIIRFGIDDSHPKTGNIPNRELLAQECGDIIGVVNELVNMGAIDQTIIDKYAAKKPAKIRKYKEMYDGK